MNDETGALILAGLGLTSGILPFLIGDMITRQGASVNETQAYNTGAIFGSITGMAALGSVIASAYILMR